MCQYIRVLFSRCVNNHFLDFKVSTCLQYDIVHAHDSPDPTLPIPTDIQQLRHSLQHYTDAGKIGFLDSVRSKVKLSEGVKSREFLSFSLQWAPVLRILGP